MKFTLTFQCGIMMLTATAFVPQYQTTRFLDRSVAKQKLKSSISLPTLYYKDDDDNDVATILEIERVPRNKLNWKFKGLTLWLELEEYRSDITNAIFDLASHYQTELIPKSHTTAIYGMTHLSVDEAIRRLHKVKDVVTSWPTFDPPTGVVADIAEEGQPGQVCSIAWCELTLSTNEEHEKAMDALTSVFFDDEYRRNGNWKPHNSIAYDNPEEATFSLRHLIKYVAEHPSLVMHERRVEAISLWDTNGRMEDWRCLDRVYF